MSDDLTRCIYCRAEFIKKHKTQILCSIDCKNMYQRKKSPVQYNGQFFTIHSNGYYRNKLMQCLHRLKYEKEISPIPPGFLVHHIDGNMLNNDIENLQCLSRSDHITLHNKERHKNKAKVQCTTEGCQVDSKIKGLCKKHYMRKRYHDKKEKP